MFRPMCFVIIFIFMFTVDKTLPEMKQLIFKMAKTVFCTANRFGVGFDSEGYNQVLKDFFKETMKMSDRSEPKYVLVL